MAFANVFCDQQKQRVVFGCCKCTCIKEKTTVLIKPFCFMRWRSSRFILTKSTGVDNFFRLLVSKIKPKVNSQFFLIYAMAASLIGD